MLDMRKVINLVEGKTQLNEGGGAGVDFKFDDAYIDYSSIEGKTVAELKGDGVKLPIRGHIRMESYQDARDTSESMTEDETKAFIKVNFEEVDEALNNFTVETVTFDENHVMHGAGWIRADFPETLKIDSIALDLYSEDAGQDNDYISAVIGEFDEIVKYEYQDLDSYDDEEEFEESINEETSKTEGMYKNMYNFWKQNSLEKLFSWLKDSYGTDAENLMHGFMKHYSEDQELQNEFKKSSFIG